MKTSASFARGFNPGPQARSVSKDKTQTAIDSYAKVVKKKPSAIVSAEKNTANKKPSSLAAASLPNPTKKHKLTGSSSSPNNPKPTLPSSPVKKSLLHPNQPSNKRSQINSPARPNDPTLQSVNLPPPSPNSPSSPAQATKITWAQIATIAPPKSPTIYASSSDSEDSLDKIINQHPTGTKLSKTKTDTPSSPSSDSSASSIVPPKRNKKTQKKCDLFSDSDDDTLPIKDQKNSARPESPSPDNWEELASDDEQPLKKLCNKLPQTENKPSPKPATATSKDRNTNLLSENLYASPAASPGDELASPQPPKGGIAAQISKPPSTLPALKSHDSTTLPTELDGTLNTNKLLPKNASSAPKYSTAAQEPAANLVSDFQTAIVDLTNTPDSPEPLNNLRNPDSPPRSSNNSTKLPSLLFNQSIENLANGLNPANQLIQQKAMSLSSPKRQGSKPTTLAPSPNSVTANQFALNLSTKLTAQFSETWPKIQPLLAGTYNHDPSADKRALDPTQGPFQVDISEDDGSFWVVNSSGQPVYEIPTHITLGLDPSPKEDDFSDEEDSTDWPGLPKAKIRRKALRQLLSGRGDIHSVEQMVRHAESTFSGSDVTKLFNQLQKTKYPNSKYSTRTIYGPNHPNDSKYQCSMTNYHNDLPIIAESDKSPCNAYDKLCWFLVAQSLGLSVNAQPNTNPLTWTVPHDFPDSPSSNVMGSNLNALSSNLSPVPNHNPASDQMDISPPSSPSNMKSTLDEARGQYFERVANGQLEVLDFGERSDLKLYFTSTAYDVKDWDQEENRAMLDCLQWKRPTDDNEVKIYSAFASYWQDEFSLRADSTISHTDAAAKLLYFSRMVDEGLFLNDELITTPSGYFVVPGDFRAYPLQKTTDPLTPLSAIFKDQKYYSHITNHTDSSRTEVEQATRTSSPCTPSTKPTSSLRRPTYKANLGSNGKSNKISPFQKLLHAALAPPDSSCADGTFLVTAVLHPEEGVHPVAVLSKKTAIIMQSGIAIDPDFKLHPVLSNFKKTHKPLTSIEEIPEAARELGPYAHVAGPWQLMAVRNGQKDKDGNPKKQGPIYATYRMESILSPTTMLNYLLPELDTLNIRINLKGVQIPNTESNHAILGVNPDSCLEGLRYLITKIYEVELKAKAKNGECTKAEAVASEHNDLFFRKAGLRTTRLISPEDRSKYGAEGFISELKNAIFTECPMESSPFHLNLLKSASTSGTLREFLGSKATLVPIPKNTYNISQANSRNYMKLVRTHMSINHHHESTLLEGITDTCRVVRAQLRPDANPETQYKRKNISINTVLRNVQTQSGDYVFTSLVPYMMGPNIGSTLATSRRLPEISQLRDKIVTNPIFWIYWYCYDYLGLTDACVNLLLASCDPEPVLLIPETEWDPSTWTVTSPFEEATDEFLASAQHEGIVLDMSAMAVSPNFNNHSPNPNGYSDREIEAARRLRLKDDATLTSQNTGAVSRVTTATQNTTGADTFRTTTSTERRRNFREDCLRKARASSQQATSLLQPSLSNNDLGLSPGSKGQPASKGSAATPPSKTDSTNLSSAMRGSGAGA